MSKASADKGITASSLNEYYDRTYAKVSSSLSDTASYVASQYNSAADYVSSKYPSPWISTKHEDDKDRLGDLPNTLTQQTKQNRFQSGNLPFLIQYQNDVGSRSRYRYHALQSPTSLKKSLRMSSLNFGGLEAAYPFPDFKKAISYENPVESTSNSILSESIEDEFEREKSKSTPKYSPAEAAAHLAEGTIRLLRDIELDEAIQLRRSLAFWSNRLERPFLSWLEAGPWVWFSEEGYSHQSIAEKISQIQAVLARRVAAIGELQQQLLRAAWQKGVASWIVLGGHGEWAAVAGFDGEMKTETMDEERTPTKERKISDKEKKRMNLKRQRLEFGTVESAMLSPPIGLRRSESIKRRESLEVVTEEGVDNNAHQYYGNADVVVDAKAGGKIKTDEAALTEWSIDAIRLVRGQLFRAGHGDIPLPYIDNWVEDLQDVGSAEGQVIVSEPSDDGSKRILPKWAAFQLAESCDDNEARVRNSIFRSQTNTKGCIEISDLPLMAAEVSELMNSIEDIMDYQKDRGLRQLKAMPRMRRNWYLYASGVPVATYLLIKLLKNGELLRFSVSKIKAFYNEHLWAPMKSM